MAALSVPARDACEWHVVLRPEAPAERDVDLVARARAGDLAAFEALYRRHVGLVHALCRRMTGSSGRAEELTLEESLRDGPAGEILWGHGALFRL